MRDEGPFILEWLAHHKALGVTGFLIFSNDCSDGTDRLLDALATAGEIVHVPQVPTGKSVQWPALRAAADHPLCKAADWVMCIDCDEFVNLRTPLDSLHDLIASRPEADAFALPWRFFGHGGHLGFEPGPVTERFTMAAPQGMLFPAASRFFKTLYRTDARGFARPGIHRPKARKSAKDLPHWVDGSGTRLPDDLASDETRILLAPDQTGTDLVQLNHYSLRSAEDFLVKRARGLPNRQSKPLDASYWAERNFNVVEDASILRHAAARVKEEKRLRTLPGVEDAHDTAVRAYRGIINDLLKDADAVHLYSRLALLAGSEPPDTSTGKRLLTLIHASLKPQD
ncbi:MAG: glycosyltransferase family 2 protein [Rhodobacteraceae bacterium]|nr:glycosyltransferase family 2 protein [Paracoccaceae bacterium]